MYAYLLPNFEVNIYMTILNVHVSSTSSISYTYRNLQLGGVDRLERCLTAPDHIPAIHILSS